MKTLRTVFLLACFTIGVAFTAHAQTQLGGGLIYGSEIEKLGIRAEGIHSINDDFRVAADISYFFPDKESGGGFDISATWWAINFNGHYLFVNQESLRAYALAGLNIGIITAKASFMGESESESESELGLNLGGGIEIPVNTVSLFGELKAAGLGGDGEQLVLGAGVRVRI
ncbi:MAG: hypothetical protein WD035_03675 [Balneolaceae bacterium]